MKYQPEVEDVEISKDLEEHSFTIESSPIAFEILSGNIYKDRILAIIRELSCNAYDSHCDAIDENTKQSKNNIPFKIKLPNSFEPNFVIRDYGVGLSPLMVKKLYTRYFKSTKTDSNKYVGFMGLGSKSPFSYTNSFNVNSYWNGVKYSFCAYKNEIKKPCITELGSTPTIEENGLEIIIPVDSYDFHQFKIKTQQALTFFDVKPEVTGITDFNIPTRKYLLKTDKFGVFEQESHDSSHVVMGNVGYNVSVDDLEEEITNTMQQKILEWGVDIFLNIGEVIPAASREEITWTKKAKQIVVEAINEVIQKLKEDLQNKINSFKTIWDARLFNYGIQRSIYRFCTDVYDVKWNNMPASYIVEAGVDEKIFDIDKKNSNRRNRYKAQSSIDKYKFNTSYPMRIVAKPNAFYYIDDLEQGGRKRILNHLVENNNLNAHDGFLIENMSDERIKEIGFEHLIIKSSTLPEPPKVTRQYYNKTKRTTLQVYSGHALLKDANVNLDEGGIFVECKYSKFKVFNQFDNHYNFDKFIKRLNYFNISPVVYTIRPFELHKIKDNKNWITFFDYAKNEFSKLSNIAESVVNYKTFNDFSNDVYEIKSIFHNAKLKNEKDSDFYKIIEFFNSIKTKEPLNMSVFEELNKLFNNPFNLEPKDFKWVKDIFKKYPLIDPYATSNKNEFYVEYIDLIDQQNLVTV